MIEFKIMSCLWFIFIGITVILFFLLFSLFFFFFLFFLLLLLPLLFSLLFLLLFFLLGLFFLLSFDGALFVTMINPSILIESTIMIFFRRALINNTNLAGCEKLFGLSLSLFSIIQKRRFFTQISLINEIHN